MAPVDLSGHAIIFVLGGPGSGKGTQCAKIVEKYGYCHLSTGDLLRDEVKSGSDRAKELTAIMAEGKLVSMDAILQLVREAMDKNKDCKGFLIDGFPRDIPQGVKFEQDIGKCKRILYFKCTEECMTKRLLIRAKSSGRVDDNIETIKKRLHTFVEQTVPVVTGNEFKDRVQEIDAERDKNVIFSDVCACLDNM